MWLSVCGDSPGPSLLSQLKRRCFRASHAVYALSRARTAAVDSEADLVQQVQSLETEADSLRDQLVDEVRFFPCFALLST